MKQHLISIFSLILAAMIIYGGSGVNLVSYCCSGCEALGVSAVYEGCCDEIHHRQHDESAHDHSHNHDKCQDAKVAHVCVRSAAGDPCLHMESVHACGVERVSFEWMKGDVQEFSFRPIVMQLFQGLGISYLSLTPTLSFNSYELCAASPPPLCPRGYLSLLSVLLI